MPGVSKEPQRPKVIYAWYLFALIFSQNWRDCKISSKSTRIIKICFLGIFQILCNFSWKLAQKPTKVWTLRYFQFFWHPWHPWGWLSSGDTWVLNISLQWRNLAEIFSFIKMIFHVSFIILVLKIVILSVAIATKLTISKIYHLIRLRFEQSEHKKSQRL